MGRNFFLNFFQKRFRWKKKIFWILLLYSEKKIFDFFFRSLLGWKKYSEYFLRALIENIFQNFSKWLPGVNYFSSIILNLFQMLFKRKIFLWIFFSNFLDENKLFWIFFKSSLVEKKFDFFSRVLSKKCFSEFFTGNSILILFFYGLKIDLRDH